MAYTFLQAVNSTLKRAGVIQGDSGALTTFTDSARQTSIDVMLDAWNDVIAELYKTGDHPGEQEENTFTLSTGVGEYTLATDYTKILGNPVDATNERVILPYPGAFEDLRMEQLDPSDYTGLPNFWVINPTNNKIRLDRQATANENGNVYTYINEKRINLAATTDPFPFSDEVVDALKAAVVQAWNSEQKGQFNAATFQASISRGASLISRTKPRKKYGTHGIALVEAWPLN